MKELIKRYEAAKEKANEISDRYEAEPENEKIEKEFDKAYKAEFKAFAELTEAIVNITNGQIDARTARTMIQTRIEDLKIISEIA